MRTFEEFVRENHSVEESFFKNFKRNAALAGALTLPGVVGAGIMHGIDHLAYGNKVTPANDVKDLGNGQYEVIIKDASDKDARRIALDRVRGMFHGFNNIFKDVKIVSERDIQGGKRFLISVK